MKEVKHGGDFVIFQIYLDIMFRGREGVVARGGAGERKGRQEGGTRQEGEVQARRKISYKYIRRSHVILQ